MRAIPTIRSVAVRSGLRFAITVVVTDAVVLATFGESNAALLGSFAVAIHLYFLDFDGDVGERFAGHGIATLIGCVAVVVGVLCASPTWLAVAATFVVSSSFAYLRVLHGYVARSAVGLQGAFFLPLMVATGLGAAPSLLGGWLVGSGISIVAALVVLPHRRTGRIRALLADWLRAAASIATAVQQGDSLASPVEQLARCRDALVEGAVGVVNQPGAVGRRQRALSNMVVGARWSMPVAEGLAAIDPRDASELGRISADAFEVAAELVTGSVESDMIPDLPTARRRDLEELTQRPREVVRDHYAVRLLSIAAMNQLFNAACSRGRSAPLPDVGRSATQRPFTVLRQNLRWNSVWTRNALRTGLGAAACVVMVRLMGLGHGVWVVLAALAVTQVSLSGSTGTTTMAKVAFGSTTGVLLAGAITALHLGHPVVLVILPIAAFLAKRTAGSGMLIAQLTYAPFALVNFSVLAWPPHPGLEVVRAENVLIGALVAAVFSVLVFPSGAKRLLDTLRASALRTSRDYLDATVDALRAGAAVAPDLRDAAFDELGAYGTALDAAFMNLRGPDPELSAHEEASAVAHDLLIGGDACAELAAIAGDDPAFRPVAHELADWWERFASVRSSTAQ